MILYQTQINDLNSPKCGIIIVTNYIFLGLANSNDSFEFAKQSNQTFRTDETTMSKYDAYFDRKSSKGKALCLKCGKPIQISGRSTYGMKSHLKTHDIIIDDNEDLPSPAPVPRKSQNTLDSFVIKESLEESVSREASQFGATFRYLGRSILVRKGLTLMGYQNRAPRSHRTVQRLVHKSANIHRNIVRNKIQKLLKNSERFCVVTDEWTCSSKRRRYQNVILHVKGK